ncbi:MAG: hypothetical protein RIA63_06285 [Cyclobacteriaceae bacterium]
MIKQIALSIASFFAGVLITTAANMGIVMLLFYPVQRFSLILSASIVFALGAMEGILGGSITAAIPSKPSYGHLYAVLIYTAGMVIFSIAMNASLEPLWYKLVHLAVMAPLFIVGGRWTMRKRQSRTKSAM